MVTRLDCLLLRLGRVLGRWADEGSRWRFGVNYRTDVYSTVIFCLMIPFWAYGMWGYYDWESDCYMSGCRLLCLRIYSRKRRIDGKRFSSISTASLPLGKQTVVATREMIEDYPDRAWGTW